MPGHPPQTLHTLAADLKVSYVTVSLALNDSPRLALETRRRIQEHAARVGYRPNRAARGLKMKSSRVFGCVLPNVTSPFLAQVADQLYRAALDAGYMLQIVFSGCDAEEERKAVDECLALPVDGLIVSSSFPPGPSFPEETGEEGHPLARVAASGLPLVVTAPGWRLMGRSLPSVHFDPEKSFHELTVHLAGQGCRRFRLLLNVSDRELAASRAEGGALPGLVERRIAGFRRALDELGLEYDPASLVSVVIPFDAVWVRSAAQESYHENATHLKALVDAALANAALPQEDGEPVGLLCMNDQLAAHAWDYCFQAGLEIPRQVAVAGCDDTLAPYLGLTSFRWDYERYAREVVGHLLAQIEGRTPRAAKPVGGRVIARHKPTAATGMKKGGNLAKDRFALRRNPS